MGRTTIEWTDRSVNPVRARRASRNALGHYCEKISPGCTHCYAEAYNRRMRPLITGLRIGTGLPYQRASLEELTFEWDERQVQPVLTRRSPARYFWFDMTDPFGAWVTRAWLVRAFAIMAATPQHTHQLLTKRPREMRQVLRDPTFEAAVRAAVFALADPPPPVVWPLPNVWLGVSTETQHWAAKRIPLLQDTPAAVRFISAEPLLGPLDLTRLTIAPELERNALEGLDWVIVGGESGYRARRTAVDWIRQVVADCHAARVPVFVKQLGSSVIESEAVDVGGSSDNSWPARLAARVVADGATRRIRLRDRKGGNPDEWPPALRHRELPSVSGDAPW